MKRVVILYTGVPKKEHAKNKKLRELIEKNLIFLELEERFLVGLWRIFSIDNSIRQFQKTKSTNKATSGLVIKNQNQR